MLCEIIENVQMICDLKPELLAPDCKAMRRLLDVCRNLFVKEQNSRQNSIIGFGHRHLCACAMGSVCLEAALLQNDCRIDRR